MAIERPTIEQLQVLASRLNIRLTPAQAEEYPALMQVDFDVYDLIDALIDETPAVHYPRAVGYRSEGDENPLNAWYYKTEATGAATGKLAGHAVVLKDNIALAGVPMTNGASTLEGFVPLYDATVATRLLDAGAIILGKATCEHFYLSRGSHTSDPTPVHDPLCRGYSASGSSSGSTALIASGEIDLAMGGDQGDSARIPAAWCNLYGLKPIHGLMPYTGIMPIEATFDHTGPMAYSVKDSALVLEVITGADGLDPHQYVPKVETYTEALGKGVRGLKIGTMAEGFQLPNLDAQVAEKVHAAVARLQELGVTVGEVSVSEHSLTGMLWSPIGCEGLIAQMMYGNGMSFNWKGQYDVALLDKHAQWRDNVDTLSPSLKICMFVGQYGLGRYHGRYYARAQNTARRTHAGYDRALADFDLLVMPIVLLVTQPLPEPDCSITEYISRAFEMIGNTAPQDITGHPAMALPCGLVDGLPVGMMLVGRHFAESTLYQAAAALEASGGWRMF